MILSLPPEARLDLWVMVVVVARNGGADEGRGLGALCVVEVEGADVDGRGVFSTPVYNGERWEMFENV